MYKNININATDATINIIKIFFFFFFFLPELILS